MMSNQKALFCYLDESARKMPEQIAIEEPGNGAISYQDLAALSDKVRDKLIQLGVRKGDRVGVYLHKSIDAVATFFGIMKCGAAYVPVDAGAPVARNIYILKDCAVKVIVMEKSFEERFVAGFGEGDKLPERLLLEGCGGGIPLIKSLADRAQYPEPEPAQTVDPDHDDIAYILYTSGSTGKPKGVILTQQNAVSFVDWCSEAFEPNEKDRFSSHAPFHFDLSILDIYLPLKHGATLVLIAEDIGKDPLRLARLFSEERITIWYSTPSILSLLTQFGKMEQYDYSPLRICLFAGEVFPIKHLKALKSILPAPAYYNLYGPTETNVCTYYPIPDQIPDSQTKPFPIGKTCSHLESIVVDERGNAVKQGEEGELCIYGPGVTQGYWNLPERTAKAFLVDSQGCNWYKTGDIVVEEPHGNYVYVGRRDRMVKKRCYRVELGEIESVLYNHPLVKEAAVIALMDDVNGVRVKAFLGLNNGQTGSIIEMKRYCVENLPVYMVPDLFTFLDVLPKTSTDKIDYQRLKEMA
jgi:amino acid adenylation domain-containing protein